MDNHPHPSEFLSKQDCEWVAEIARALGRRNAVLFVGAGFSLNAKHIRRKSIRMPLWEDLRKGFLAKLPDLPKHTEVLTAAELYERAFGRVSLVETIDAAILDNDFEPGEVHRLMAQLDWHDIITTNYDTLVERSLQNLGITPHVVTDESDLVLHRRPRVVKFAGCLKRSPFQMLITGEDYRTYATRHPLLLNFLRECFAEHLVLFVGFSLQDPLFQRVHGWVYDKLGKLKRPAYSIQANIDDLTKDFWRDMGIRIVDLGTRGPLTYGGRMRALLHHLRSVLLNPENPAPLQRAQTQEKEPEFIPEGSDRLFDTLRQIVDAHLQGKKHLLQRKQHRARLWEIVNSEKPIVAFLRPAPQGQDEDERPISEPQRDRDSNKELTYAQRITLTHALLIAWCFERRWGPVAQQALSRMSSVYAASDDGLCQSLSLLHQRLFASLPKAHEVLRALSDGRNVGAGHRDPVLPPGQRFLYQHCFDNPRSLGDEYLRALDELRLQADGDAHESDDVFWQRYHLLSGYLQDYEKEGPRLLLRRERARAAGKVAERRALLGHTTRTPSRKMEMLLVKLHNGKRLGREPVGSLASIWAAKDDSPLPWELVTWLTLYSTGSRIVAKHGSRLRRLIAAERFDIEIMFGLLASRLDETPASTRFWRDEYGHLLANDVVRFFEGAAELMRFLVPFIDDEDQLDRAAAIVAGYASACHAPQLRSAWSLALAALTHKVTQPRRVEIQNCALRTAVRDGELPVLHLSKMHWASEDEAETSLVRAALLKAVLPDYQATDFAMDVKRWALARYQTKTLDLSQSILIEHFTILVAEDLHQEDFNWIVLIALAHQANLPLVRKRFPFLKNGTESTAYDILSHQLRSLSDKACETWRLRQFEYLPSLHCFTSEMGPDLFDFLFENMPSLQPTDDDPGRDKPTRPQLDALLEFLVSARQAHRVFHSEDDYKAQVLPNIKTLIELGATGLGTASQLGDLLADDQRNIRDALERNILALWMGNPGRAAHISATALRHCPEGVTLEALVDRVVAASWDSSPEVREAALGCLVDVLENGAKSAVSPLLNRWDRHRIARDTETDVPCKQMWLRVEKAVNLHCGAATASQPSDVAPEPPEPPDSQTSFDTGENPS